MGQDSSHDSLTLTRIKGTGGVPKGAKSDKLQATRQDWTAPAQPLNTTTSEDPLAHLIWDRMS